MTNKTTMPAPMVEVDKHVVSPELQYTYLAPCGGLEHGTELITTEQAEAYANTRVKQALEEAAMILKSNAESCNIDTAIMLRANADAIRALIPKEPPCET